MAEGSVWEAANVALLSQARQPLRHHRRQRSRPEHADAVRSPHGRTRRALERVRLAHADRRRPRRPGAAARVRRRARRQGPSDDDPGATLKGKGVKSVEGKEGWHGKAFKKGEEADKAIAELKAQIVDRRARARRFRRRRRSRATAVRPDYSKMPPPSYKPGEQVATREAWGTALAALGGRRSARRRARRRRQELDVQRSLREGASRSLLSELHRRADHGRRGDGARRARRDRVSVDVRLLPRPAPPTSSAWPAFRTRAISCTSSSPARIRASRSARTVRRRWRSRISR